MPAANDRTLDGDLGEVLIELHAVGGAMRCTAVDPVSGLEVVVAGPLDGGELLERTAVAKLRRALERQRRAAAPVEQHHVRRRGWVV